MAVDTAVSPQVQPYAFSSLGSTLQVHAAATPPSSAAAWSPSHSETLYRVDRWGPPYFAVNSAGDISVRPFGDDTLPHQEIDLLKVVKKASSLGLQLPLVVRFPDVLRNRLESIQSAFDSAIESRGYGAHFQGVYPVKSNQDRFVVEDIVEFGSGFRFGLESGSKPELLLAMSCLCSGSPDALLICNGFKDAEYVSLALVAKKLRFNSVIVLEEEDELDVVIDAGRKLGIRPVIGLRAKLRTKHAGHFGSTSGEKGKFGLTTAQILRVVKKLGKFEMLDCLQLLHFHVGSQIPSTSLLADGVVEAAQIYCELFRRGAAMEFIDVGGGLGIDYDGSRSGDSDISVSYSLHEYASTVVKTVAFVCDRNSVKHPVICSESGRAIVSHHSVLVFEAVSASFNGDDPQRRTDSPCVERLSDDARAAYNSLYAAAMRKERERCVFLTEELKGRCVEQFKQGNLEMEVLAAVDGFCDFICVSDEIMTYHVNLSVFTSIPDFWGIGQLFPIVPIHRLDEKPELRGFLSDLTCDSDGKIDRFIGGEASLPLHKLVEDTGGGAYYLGMFLGGAYEEALGGIHNLFGRPSVARVVAQGGDGFVVKSAVAGASCGEVLRAMGHRPQAMLETLRQRVEEFAGDGGAAGTVMDGFFCCLGNMPYLAGAAAMKGGGGGGGDEAEE
ncbi:arginine decarboxylase-like [Salvia hispanica]|uniref:arginine decarboxylase-like n=1 Tax=Salvia hispanica TaxID=49212 RepID=UPI0020098A4F|nr:arginine decarboxylase-like [Salvia hispanica]